MMELMVSTGLVEDCEVYESRLVDVLELMEEGDEERRKDPRMLEMEKERMIEVGGWWLVIGIEWCGVV